MTNTFNQLSINIWGEADFKSCTYKPFKTNAALIHCGTFPIMMDVWHL